MKGLLDYIFDNLDFDQLSRQEVRNHLIYLHEVLPQLSSKNEERKFIFSLIKLNERLITLNKTDITTTNQSINRNDKNLKFIIDID